jgi:hypothetical protein
MAATGSHCGRRRLTPFALPQNEEASASTIPHELGRWDWPSMAKKIETMERTGISLSAGGVAAPDLTRYGLAATEWRCGGDLCNPGPRVPTKSSSDARIGSGMDHDESLEHAFKIDQAVQEDGQDRGAGHPTKPTEHQPVCKHLSHVIKVILQMDDGPEQIDQDDHGPCIVGRAVPTAKQKAAKESFFADWRHHEL